MICHLSMVQFLSKSSSDSPQSVYGSYRTAKAGKCETEVVFFSDPTQKLNKGPIPLPAETTLIKAMGLWDLWLQQKQDEVWNCAR